MKTLIRLALLLLVTVLLTAQINNPTTLTVGTPLADANHAVTVAIGSGTSIGVTSFCSTVFCPAGTYEVNVYVDITTPCGTSGTYLVSLTYTDDQGSKAAVLVPVQGTGSVPATGLITTTSTANYGQASLVLRTTGAAALQYSTTAAACGTAGPMVGNMYISAVRQQ